MLCIALATACLPIAEARADAATATTTNFEVVADSDELARLLANRAEELRESLAVEWLETEVPAWETRCIVRVDTARVRLSGDTTYAFSAGRVMRWKMELRGPPERILETLLPHEVLHTVLASYYQRAVPRWADEGAALSVEPEVERERLWAQEGPHLLQGRRQSLHELFACDQYPEGQDHLRAFYVQGASVTEFLLLGGKVQFVDFVESGMQDGWDRAAEAHYGFASLDHLESAWLAWLHGERPAVELASGRRLAEAIEVPTMPIVASDLRGLRPAANGGAQ